MFSRAWMVRISVGIVVVMMALASSQSSHATSSGGLSSEDLSGLLAPSDLVNTLAGTGITISNISYAGAENAAGTFSGGTGIIGFEKGIILSSGDIANVVGPNMFDGVSAINDTPGDADLDAESGSTTLDAALLEFDFVADADTVEFNYVFASEEYNEFVNSLFNDVFAFFINGVNCAKAGGDAVSINTVNNDSHPELYLNNALDSRSEVINTEMDGLTVVLTCQAPVTPGQTNHIKLVIADSTDRILDSNVFLQAGSFTAKPKQPSCDLNAVPQVINASLQNSSLATSYNAADPRAPAGVYTITSTFTNISPTSLCKLSYKVTILSPGNKTVLNCDGGPGGVGCVVSVPANALGADGILSPNESVTVKFEIGLDKRERFNFFVDAYGVPVQ